MLLILFLMGRRPEMLVPDDVDPNDYEVHFLHIRTLTYKHYSQFNI